MEKISRLSQQQRADLVAYLDGELDEATTRSIEETLAKSPVARHDVNLLLKTYELLDKLPRPSLGQEFTTRTVGVLTRDDAANQWSGLSISSTFRSDAARRGAICVGWVAGLVLAALGGFLLTNRWIPDESRMLVEELPLIEKLDDYSKVESIEFLRELQARVGTFDDASKSPRN
ncbi:MAG: anti-sigma factor [Planctomycetaceae bacterium]